MNSLEVVPELVTPDDPVFVKFDYLTPLDPLPIVKYALLVVILDLT